MKIKKLVQAVNRLTGQGTYSYSELAPYFDECIDEINESLSLQLPPVSDIYANDFYKTEEEEERVDLDPSDPKYLEFEDNSLENKYTRMPSQFLRNYVAYEVSVRIQRDEDEEPDVYRERQRHAYVWFSRLVANYGNFKLRNRNMINFSPADSESIEDRSVYHNPYADLDGD